MLSDPPLHSKKEASFGQGPAAESNTWKVSNWGSGRDLCGTQWQNLISDAPCDVHRRCSLVDEQTLSCDTDA